MERQILGRFHDTPFIRIFLIFLRLGCTSFGGPIAHLSFFRDEFVGRRKWLNEHSYADLVALCQFLPGPASSQVGIALGLSRGGILGAIAAWLGFTLPSAILLAGFGLGISKLPSTVGSGWLHGLNVIAAAVVAQAIWNMSKNLCPDKVRASIAVTAAVLVSLIPNTFGQISVILLGGLTGLFLLKQNTKLPDVSMKFNLSRLSGVFSLCIFFVLLMILPWIAESWDSSLLKVMSGFFRAGSLVFGGGHVVLPLLESVVVPAGFVTQNVFMAGYGAAQAVPGPLFTFAAYLGAVSKIEPSGWLGASICLISAFLPSFLLVIGVLPFWDQVRKYESVRYAMQGINAAVVGILLSAFYNPVWISAIQSPIDFSLALVGFLLLVFWNIPPWLAVTLSAVVGSYS